MKFEELRKDIQMRASVRNDHYAILKVASIPPMDENIFAIITDGSEITVVAKQEHTLEALAEERPFRIISFDTKLPFDLIGFLAYITKILANEDISLFALSSFSTDHILMKEIYLDRAIKVLEDNGVVIDYR